MKVLLIATGELASELLDEEVHSDLQVELITDPVEITGPGKYDACIDLLFSNDRSRISCLENIEATITIVSAVIFTLEESCTDFVRINGWPTFLRRPVIEASVLREDLKDEACRILGAFHRKLEWVPDIKGFVTPRVVASIVNEAYFALEDRVSSREEIDTAMKLGTNYPLGPFEWSRKIGLKSINELLEVLSAEQERYRPSALLTKEAMA